MPARDPRGDEAVSVSPAMTRAPRITVLMPVHNGALYLREAIQSILIQTFTEFEFLIIDDGSSDSSAEIIRSFRDPRIRLESNGGNLGLVETLNRGMLLARGEYLARMDCDDVSHPERLARQLRFLEQHGEVTVCGTWIKAFGAQHFIRRYPVTDEVIRAHLLFENALAHPSIMARREDLLWGGLYYDPAFSCAEDYELWNRMPPSCKFANLDRILLFYRTHAGQVSAGFSPEQVAATNAVRKRQLERFGGDSFVQSLPLHEKICRKIPDVTESFLEGAERWLQEVQRRNRAVRMYDDKGLSEIVGRYWFEACFHATELGFRAWKSYFASSLSSQAPVDTFYLLAFFVKCWFKRPSRSSAA